MAQIACRLHGRLLGRGNVSAGARRLEFCTVARRVRISRWMNALGLFKSTRMSAWGGAPLRAWARAGERSRAR
eukprot:5261183-Alexandrium_andersonii.AAC.1